MGSLAIIQDLSVFNFPIFEWNLNFERQFISRCHFHLMFAVLQTYEIFENVLFVRRASEQAFDSGRF